MDTIDDDWGAFESTPAQHVSRDSEALSPTSGDMSGIEALNASEKSSRSGASLLRVNTKDPDAQVSVPHDSIHSSDAVPDLRDTPPLEQASSAEDAPRLEATTRAGTPSPSADVADDAGSSDPWHTSASGVLTKVDPRAPLSTSDDGSRTSSMDVDILPVGSRGADTTVSTPPDSSQDAQGKIGSLASRREGHGVSAGKGSDSFPLPVNPHEEPIADETQADKVACGDGTECPRDVLQNDGDRLPALEPNAGQAQVEVNAACESTAGFAFRVVPVPSVVEHKMNAEEGQPSIAGSWARASYGIWHRTNEHEPEVVGAAEKVDGDWNAETVEAGRPVQAAQRPHQSMAAPMRTGQNNASPQQDAVRDTDFEAAWDAGLETSESTDAAVVPNETRGDEGEQKGAFCNSAVAVSNTTATVSATDVAADIAVGGAADGEEKHGAITNRGDDGELADRMNERPWKTGRQDDLDDDCSDREMLGPNSTLQVDAGDVAGDTMDAGGASRTGAHVSPRSDASAKVHSVLNPLRSRDIEAKAAEGAWEEFEECTLSSVDADSAAVGSRRTSLTRDDECSKGSRDPPAGIGQTLDDVTDGKQVAASLAAPVVSNVKERADADAEEAVADSGKGEAQGHDKQVAGTVAAPAVPDVKEGAKNDAEGAVGDGGKAGAEEDDDDWSAFEVLPAEEAHMELRSDATDPTVAMGVSRCTSAEMRGYQDATEEVTNTSFNTEAARDPDKDAIVDTGAGATATAAAVDENEGEWSDFGEFEEAPSTDEMTTEAIDAVQDQRSSKGFAQFRKPAETSGWKAFAAGDEATSTPTAITPAPSSTGEADTRGRILEGNSVRPLTREPSLADMVTLFEAIFSAETGAMESRQSIREASADKKRSRDALWDFSRLPCVGQYPQRAPTGLDAWAKSCILRGIRPVSDAVGLGDSGEEIEAGTRAKSCLSSASVQDPRASVPVVGAAMISEVPAAPTAIVVEGSQTPQSAPVPPHIELEGADIVEAPADEPQESGMAASVEDDLGTASRTSGDEPCGVGVVDPVPHEAAPSVLMPPPSRGPESTPSSTSPSPPRERAGQADNKSDCAPAVTEKSFDAGDPAGSGGAQEVSDWADDPFADFQSAPPAPPAPWASPTVPALPPSQPGVGSDGPVTAIPSGTAAPHQEGSQWSLDFLMAAPQDGLIKPAGALSADGLGGDLRPASGVDNKAPDLVSQALAGFGIATSSDAPLDPDNKGNRDDKASAFTFSSARRLSDDGGARGTAKSGSDVAGPIEVADLLRARHSRGGGRKGVWSPPQETLSAEARARLAALPDLSFMLSDRLRFPVSPVVL